MVGLYHWRMAGQIGQHIDHCACPQCGQFGGQRTCGLAINRRAHRGTHRPGIKPAFHLHDRHPGFIVTRQDRALHWCRPAPPRQDRPVNIQAPVARRVEHRLRQDQAIGGDNRDIGPMRCKRGLFIGALQADRGVHRNAGGLCRQMHRRWLQLLAPARRARRLRIGRDHLVPGRDQRVQRRHRKFGGSHEDHAHRQLPLSFCQTRPICAAMASQEIESLANALARLPGLGPRSARRAVLWLIKRRETAFAGLVEALATVRETLVECPICGNVDTTNPCAICADPRRDARALCVVEDVADLWALDRARLFTGRYHVLGGRLSALEGVRPEDLNIASLLDRVAAGGIDEVVLAMNATLEGQTTAHYLAERLEAYPVRLTQLAHGLPVGGELDYLDEGTLAQALRARRPVG